MFLIDFANFNREINIKAYTRIINGKVVPVKGARRTVLALKDSLDSLRKATQDDFEAAYIFNSKSGKTSKIVYGDDSSVRSSDLIADRVQNNKQLLKKTNTNSYILHNHPGPEAQGLSAEDLVSANYSGEKAIFAIDSAGNTYRARPTENFNNVRVRKAYNETFNMSRLDRDYDKDVFLKTHATALYVQESGDIKYRWKFTDDYKNLADKKTLDRAFLSLDNLTTTSSVNQQIQNLKDVTKYDPDLDLNNISFKNYSKLDPNLVNTKLNFENVSIPKLENNIKKVDKIFNSSFEIQDRLTKHEDRSFLAMHIAGEATSIPSKGSYGYTYTQRQQRLLEDNLDIVNDTVQKLLKTKKRK